MKKRVRCIDGGCMDIGSALQTYFSRVESELMFSGQQNGDIRKIIEDLLAATASLVTAADVSMTTCAGFYPVALIEYVIRFDTEREPSGLAMDILTCDLGAHAYQIYFLSKEGRMSLIRQLIQRNRSRRATRFYVGGRTGHVSGCYADEQLYSLIIASTPIPKTIAAA